MKLSEMTIEHLGREATEDDLRDFRDAVERIKDAIGGEQAAIDYIWGNGDYTERLDAGNGDGELLGDVLRQLAEQGNYLLSDGAQDWDPDILRDELSANELLRGVSWEQEEDAAAADESGQVGHIQTINEDGYINTGQALYTIYVASIRSR